MRWRLSASRVLGGWCEGTHWPCVHPPPCRPAPPRPAPPPPPHPPTHPHTPTPTQSHQQPAPKHGSCVRAVHRQRRQGAAAVGRNQAASQPVCERRAAAGGDAGVWVAGGVGGWMLGACGDAWTIADGLGVGGRAGQGRADGRLMAVGRQVPVRACRFAPAAACPVSRDAWLHVLPARLPPSRSSLRAITLRISVTLPSPPSLALPLPSAGAAVHPESRPLPQLHLRRGLRHGGAAGQGGVLR